MEKKNNMEDFKGAGLEPEDIKSDLVQKDFGVPWKLAQWIMQNFQFPH